MADEKSNKKKYVKEAEFAGGDAPERVRQAIDEANRRLLNVEYNGRSVLKLPLSIVIVLGLVAFLFATPFAIALTVGLAALGFLTKFSVRVEKQP